MRFRGCQWWRGWGGLQCMGSLGVGHDCTTSLYFFTFMHCRRKWQPTPVFLPGESQGQGAWWAAICWVAQSRTWLKRLSSSISSSSGVAEGQGGGKSGLFASLCPNATWTLWWLLAPLRSGLGSMSLTTHRKSLQQLQHRNTQTLWTWVWFELMY